MKYQVCTATILLTLLIVPFAAEAMSPPPSEMRAGTVATVRIQLNDLLENLRTDCREKVQSVSADTKAAFCLMDEEIVPRIKLLGFRYSLQNVQTQTGDTETNENFINPELERLVQSVARVSELVATNKNLAQAAADLRADITGFNNPRPEGEPNTYNHSVPGKLDQLDDGAVALREKIKLLPQSDGVLGLTMQPDYSGRDNPPWYWFGANNTAGFRVDWNFFPGADYYRVTTYRQDINGSAETSFETGRSHAVRHNPNAGEGEGYCYYFRITVDALSSNRDVLASDTADGCYMANKENKPGLSPLE